MTVSVKKPVNEINACPKTCVQLETESQQAGNESGYWLRSKIRSGGGKETGVKLAAGGV
jgi:hypothetical protein